jgi:phosphoribosylaminoimidazole (AIR) synthetase
MGIGITIVCSPQEVVRILSVLPEAKVIGEIAKGKDRERIAIN